VGRIQVTKIETELIEFPDDYRYYRDEKQLEQLREAIKRHGVQSIVRVWQREDGLYEIVDGWNVITICKELGIKEVLAYVHSSKENAELIALLEDLNRSQRNALDLAKVIKRWRDEKGYDRKTIAKLLNKSEQYISDVLSFYENADSDVKRMYAQKQISFRDALSIYRKMKKGLTLDDALAETRAKARVFGGGWKPVKLVYCVDCGAEVPDDEAIHRCRECDGVLRDKLIQLNTSFEAEESDEFDILDFHLNNDWRLDDAN